MSLRRKIERTALKKFSKQDTKKQTFSQRWKGYQKFKEEMEKKNEKC